MFCKNCSAQIDDGAMFCPNCGTTTDNPGGNQPPQQPPQQIPQPPPQQIPQPQYQQPQPQYQQPPQQYPQQPPQQYQQQPGYQPPRPPKKPISKKVLIPIIAVAVVAIIAVVLIFVLRMGNKYEKMDFFEIGGDEVPSVMYVLGETRKITDLTVSKSSKTEKMVVEYDVKEDQGAEMEEYAGVLMEEYEFLSVNEYDFSGDKGKNFQFAKQSEEDEDYIIVVRIDYTAEGYTLTITRGKGTLTVHDPEPTPPQPADEPVPTQPADEPAPSQPVEPAPSQPVEPAPSPVDAPKGDVELIVPGILVGKDLAEAQANAPAGITVSGPNDDGSFTFSMSKDTQQQLLAKTLQEAKDVLLDIYYDVPGVENVKWNPDDFSVAYIVINDEFIAEKNVQTSLNAIIAAGLKLPMVQVYQGKGMAAETQIGWGDDAMENIAGSAISPAFLYEWLE